MLQERIKVNYSKDLNVQMEMALIILTWIRNEKKKDKCTNLALKTSSTYGYY